MVGVCSGVSSSDSDSVDNVLTTGSEGMARLRLRVVNGLTAVGWERWKDSLNTVRILRNGRFGGYPLVKGIQ